MLKKIIVLFYFILLPSYSIAEDSIFLSGILLEKLNDINCKNIMVVPDVRGVILRTNLANPLSNYYRISPQLYNDLTCLESFLAKINNPVIIEVHINQVPQKLKIKNWELTTVIAENIRDAFIKNASGIKADRLFTVGYGEFMPIINTSNNGSNFDNRIDIIILNNINGE